MSRNDRKYYMFYVSSKNFRATSQPPSLKGNKLNGFLVCFCTPNKSTTVHVWFLAHRIIYQRPGMFSSFGINPPSSVNVFSLQKLISFHLCFQPAEWIHQLHFYVCSRWNQSTNFLVCFPHSELIHQLFYKCFQPLESINQFLVMFSAFRINAPFPCMFLLSFLSFMNKLASFLAYFQLTK